METTTPGHLFVLQGRIEKVRSDAVVVPTDRWFNVEPHWYALFGGRAPAQPIGWSGNYQRADDSGRVWFVSVHDEAPVGGRLLAERLAALIADIAKGVERPTDRAVPLIALPVLGIGAGGQGDRRGHVIRLLVQTLRQAAHDHSVDIALVASNQGVFSAVQHLRRAMDDQTWPLEPREVATARDLGEQARSGQLALLLGAGMSMAAGLPSWTALLKLLARRADIDEATLRSLADSPLDQAELIAQRLGDRLGAGVTEIIGRVDRVSLAHGLVAGMHCQEVVTTNYDTLYEDAVESTGRFRPALLPWESVHGDRSWVLKMHGDIAREESIVLTRRSFVRYDSTFRPAGSLLQSLMMTRHLLVIGTSMTDDNVIRLAIEVDDFISKDKQFGTFIDVSGAPVRAQLWEGRFRWHVCGGSDQLQRVRQMEIFLDLVAVHAAGDASWLLDERFVGLLTDKEIACTDLARQAYRETDNSSSHLLSPLRDGLASFGAKS